MRKHLIGTSATLALALIGAITACGGSPAAATASPASTCVNAPAPRHAYVVVEHLSGTTVQACVGFTTDAIDGQTLMDRSGIKYQFQKFSFGSAVCQIDNEPPQYNQCFPQGKPYWSLFTETGGQRSDRCRQHQSLVCGVGGEQDDEQARGGPGRHRPRVHGGRYSFAGGGGAGDGSVAST